MSTTGPAADGRPRRVAAGCGVVAVLAALLSIVFTQDLLGNGGGRFDASALVRIADDDPLAPWVLAHDPGFTLVGHEEHYDGIYYYAIAVDPLATGIPHTLIDQAAYRYGHPLHGWLAGLLSFGRPSLVPGALLALSLLGMFAAAWTMSRLAHALGASPWIGMAVAASPGLLFASTVDTTEPLGLALVLGAMLAWLRGRWGWAALLVVLCCMDKEQYVSVPLGIGIWELGRAVMARRLPHAWRRMLGALLAGPAALGAWYLWAHSRFGMFPATYQPGNIGGPFEGWLETLTRARGMTTSGDPFGAQLGSLFPPMTAAYWVLFLLGMGFALWARNILAVPLLLLVAITSCQGWLTLLFPHEILRTPVVTLMVALLAVLVGPRRDVPVPR